MLQRQKLSASLLFFFFGGIPLGEPKKKNRGGKTCHASQLLIDLTISTLNKI
jgi:hypothetical protein